jgi:hypothetical protein
MSSERGSANSRHRVLKHVENPIFVIISIRPVASALESLQMFELRAEQ